MPLPTLGLRCFCVYLVGLVHFQGPAWVLGIARQYVEAACTCSPLWLLLSLTYLQRRCQPLQADLIGVTQAREPVQDDKVGKGPASQQTLEPSQRATGTLVPRRPVVRSLRKGAADRGRKLPGAGARSGVQLRVEQLQALSSAGLGFSQESMGGEHL